MDSFADCTKQIAIPPKLMICNTLDVKARSMVMWTSITILILKSSFKATLYSQKFSFYYTVMMTEVKKDEIGAGSFYKQAGNKNDLFDYKQFSLYLMQDHTFVMCTIYSIHSR